MASVDSHNVWHHPHQMQVGNLKHDTYTLPKEPWAALFGEARGLDTGSPYDVQSTTTYTMPAAFQGLREMIGHQIERMVFHEGNWHMRVVMPFQKVGDANEVVWNETIFDPTLASPTPELGVVRLVQSKRIQNTASWVRYGIGYFMEHGFMNTRQGIEYHMEHLRQMAQAALETSKFDVVYTLFQYQTINREWEIKYGRFKRQKVEDVVSERVWMFASLQKYKYALKVLDIHVNEIMSKYGGKANTWIVPPPIINYFSVAKEEYTHYSIAGPRGPDIAFDNPKPLFPLNGSQVFVSRTYHTSELTGHEDILSKRSEIGEYYLFEDRFTDDHTNYRTKWRHIRIYNEDANQWFEITPKYVLDHCHLFKQDGSPRYADDNPLYQHHVEGNDGKRDIWEYSNDDQMHKAELFGEMVPHYFSAHDKLQWADTVIAALRHDYSDLAVNQFMVNWSRGLDLIRRIESIRYDEADADMWRTLLGGDNIPVESRDGPGLKSVFNVKHVVPNSATGFSDIPAPKGSIDRLLPGLQSYAGLRLLIANGDTKALGGEIEVARSFLSAIDVLVTSLRKYSPNSIYTERSNASSWWHYPTDATTFFENLVVPYRTPMFVRIAGEGEATTAGGAALGEKRWGRTIGAIIKAIRDASGSVKVEGQNSSDLFDDEGSEKRDVDVRRQSFIQLLAAMTGRLIRSPALEADVEALQDKMNAHFGKPLALASEYRSQTQMQNRVVKMIMDFEADNKGTFDVVTKKRLTESFRNMAEKFDLAYANYLKGGADGQELPQFAGDFKDFVRTTILASPTYLATFAQAMSKGESSSLLMPADPDFPELIMTAERLDAATRHSDERTDIGGAQRVTAQEISHRLNPAFINADFAQHSVRATTLVNHALATQLGHSIESDNYGYQEVDEPLPLVGGDLMELAVQAIGEHGEIQVPMHTKKPITNEDRRIHKILSGTLGSTFVANFNSVNAIATSPLQRAIAHVFCGTRIHRTAYDRYIQHNLVFPLSAVICRPHMTYSMLCMIKCLAGTEMGMTLIKDGRFEIQDDAATHSHLGTYIYYSKAVVKNPKHVFVAQEVFANGYLGGTGVRPINPVNYQAGEGESNGESVIVMAKPFNNPVTGIFSLTGRLTLGEFEDFELTEDGRLLIDTIRRYMGLFGWGEARLVDDFDKGPFDGTAEHVYNSMPMIY